jgi:hypothetical protein
MLRSEGPNRGMMMGGNLLKRVFLELKNLGELMMLRSPAGPKRVPRRAQVYQFAPIALSSGRSERTGGARRRRL